MKKPVILIAIILSVFQSLAQESNDPFQPFGNNIMFKGDMVTEPYAWAVPDTKIPDTAVYKALQFVKLSNKSYVDSMQMLFRKGNFMQSQSAKLILGVKLDPKLKYYYQDWMLNRAYTITNNSEAVLIAMGINKSNVNDYRYHVVMNDSIEVVPWSIPKLAQNYGAKVPYGFIGRFKAPGKRLYIEVINIKDYSVRDAVIFDWKTNFKPIIEAISVYSIYKECDNCGPILLNDTAANHHLATKFDPVTNTPLDLKFRQGEIYNLSLTFESHVPVPYIIYLVKKLPGKKPKTIHLANLSPDESGFNFKSENYNTPGKYELIVRSQNPYDTSSELRMPFEVLPPLPLLQKYSIKQMLPYIIGGLVFVILCFGGYYLYNKRKLRLAERARAMANIQLKSVRTQLNPHFMFNALTSIQNLMNHQDTAGANHYLSKFADLTRHVLNSSEQELISLEDELAIITDYLQMEQLRFGFRYDIDVDTNINKANTEIPAMLLQPFIENAAKHGVSKLQDKGEINVCIVKQDQNIVLTITDNGQGFNAAANNKGFGLKLSNERIDLLNSIYKDQPIYLTTESSTNGTKITIALTNWA